MSKQKMLGDNPVIELEMKDCVVSTMVNHAHPAVSVKKNKADPGAVYLTFQTTGGWYGVLRGVYDAKKAKNVPKADKPEVSVYQVKAGVDDVIVMVGNYNIGDGIEKLKDDDHSIVDDVMLFMASNEEAKTLHDADGFIRLNWKSGYGPHYHPRKFRGRAHERPYDIQIDCDGIKKDDTDIINLVNTIAMFTDRAEISYTTGFDYYDYYERGRVDVSTARKILTKKPILDIVEDMEKRKFAKAIVDEFTETLGRLFITTEDDRRHTEDRLKRSSKKFDPFEDDDD